jgi:hypothetical protein
MTTNTNTASDFVPSKPTVLTLCSFSGNVGKSSMAKHLKPLFPDCKVYAVESQNNAPEGYADEIFDAAQFRTAMTSSIKARMTGGNVLIDIGSSSIPAMKAAVAGCLTALSAIRGWLVPVTIDPKIVTDTLATVEYLVSVGVPANRIAVVVNKVPFGGENSADFAKALGPVLAQAKKLGYHVLRQTVHQSEAFTLFHREQTAFADYRDITFDSVMANMASYPNEDVAAEAVSLGGLAQASEADIAAVAAELDRSLP